MSRLDEVVGTTVTAIRAVLVRVEIMGYRAFRTKHKPAWNTSSDQIQSHVENYNRVGELLDMLKRPFSLLDRLDALDGFHDVP
jgi:hypothetical protein